MFFLGFVKRAFAVTLFDTLGQKILNLSVYRTKIILRPGGKLLVKTR